jgi:hypothetical protein
LEVVEPEIEAAAEDLSLTAEKQEHLLSILSESDSSDDEVEYDW